MRPGLSLKEDGITADRAFADPECDARRILSELRGGCLGLWDEESYGRYIEAQADLLRAAKGDMSVDIRRIRKNLKLTQAKAGRAFGVGKVAFSRYERGKTRPPAPLVKLLKLVQRHPDLLSEIREGTASH